MPAPTSFISYSWDDDKHKSWVLDLATRLRLNGVDIRIDQWDVAPGQSLTQFMEQQVTACDFTIVICTPNYAQRSAKRSGGVGYEQQIISGQIAGGVARERFIPVLRAGEFQPGANCGIPAQFFGIYAVDMRDDEKAIIGFEQLLRVVHGVPLITRPDVGSKPFDTLPQSLERLRLPTIDLDGYELVSGEAQNARHPQTFHIPTVAERNSVAAGKLVKLMFDLESDDGEASCERMWVIMQERRGPYYIGKLDNEPAIGPSILAVGSAVTFLPEHIIDFYDDPRA